MVVLRLSPFVVPIVLRLVPVSLPFVLQSAVLWLLLEILLLVPLLLSVSFEVLLVLVPVLLSELLPASCSLPQLVGHCLWIVVGLSQVV